MSHSQDMIFTLYGDYLRKRGGEAWTGNLIELLGHFGISAQAVRSTLSRMSKKGWLHSHRVSRYSFYSLTPKCINLLEEGTRRIYQPRSEPWDGRWHLLIYSIPETKRHLRRRLRRRLLWLGYGSLNHNTWISPRDLKDEVIKVLKTLDIHCHVELFSSEHQAFSSSKEIVARCWDLESLNAYHAALIERYEPLFQESKARLRKDSYLEPQDCFQQRFMLVHEYRSSPYVDPNLPLELLPDDWLGERATQLFQHYHKLLSHGAEAYVDSVIAKAPEIDSA
jgi:phenylacetic acid degradation operon negative regulatory protein